ncbi:MAG TPA: ATP-binding protein [Verrucomicrobiae bacterium]|nr:ATP-binding protein [Verrucomicrobiae bacterium]
MKSGVVFILENAVWPAFLLDGSGTIIRANPAAVKTFGPVLEGGSPRLSAVWSSENGTTPEQFLAHWSVSPAGTATLKYLVKGGGTAVFLTQICSFSREEEKLFLFQVFPPATPAAGNARNPVAESSFAQKQKLDCALQLARTVSLDFNNALTSILGHTSLLLGKAEPGHPWRRSLLEVEKSAQRAAEISNELAAFSRQEMETAPAASGNLNALVSRCVDFLRNASGASIAWNVQLGKGLFAARFDEAKLQQALTKVLENSVESISGGGRITAQTRNLELASAIQDGSVQLVAGNYVCVEITDTGSGIELDVMPRIFEPFFTTKGKNHRGLGLVLAYGIVSNHGGGVAVSSQPGTGTSVRIYLPAEKRLADESAGIGGDLHGSETVLVVDDEALLLRMAETILTEFGYKVLAADGGQKALAILARNEPRVDLVITDLVMPGMSGRELVDRIRQLAPSTRILCMSGYLLSADKQPGAPFLRKPFTSRELLARVRQVVVSNLNVDE